MIFFSIEVIPRITQFNDSYISIKELVIMLSVLILIYGYSRFVKKGNYNISKEESHLLDTYIFRFKVDHFQEKEVSYKKRITAIIMAIILIFTPLSILIPTIDGFWY